MIIRDQEIAIDGYYVKRRNRNKFRGGAAMYIHNSVEYKIRDDLMNFEIECLMIQVKDGMSKPFLVHFIPRIIPLTIQIKLIP